MTTFLNAQNKTKKTTAKSSICWDDCEATNKKGQLSCKLTTPELRQRKETVIKSLKNQILEKKELKMALPTNLQGQIKWWMNLLNL